MDSKLEQAEEVVITTPKPRTSWGAIIGLLLVVVIVVAGAFYMLGERVAHERQPLHAAEERSESTEPEAIEADLAAQTPEEFEEDIDAAFAELDAALAE